MRLFIKNKIRTGFTLIELILYMALMSIFLIVLSELFISILEVRKESEAVSSVEQDGRFILTRLNYDLNRATSVTTPASLGETSTNLVIVIGGDTFTYALTGSNFQLTNTNGTDNINSSGSQISDISFKRIGNSGGNPTIKIAYTVTSVTQRVGGAEVKTFNTTIGLR